MVHDSVHDSVRDLGHLSSKTLDTYHSAEVYYGVMPAGVCAVTLSLLKRAWTTSARPELAGGRIRSGGTPPWLPHLRSILLSLGLCSGLGQGFRVSVAVRQLRSPASCFVPSSLPFFPTYTTATKTEVHGYQGDLVDGRERPVQWFVH